MADDGDSTKGERREDRRRKGRFGPRMHGKRLAELVRNALRRRQEKER